MATKTGNATNLVFLAPPGLRDVVKLAPAQHRGVYHRAAPMEGGSGRSWEKAGLSHAAVAIPVCAEATGGTRVWGLGRQQQLTEPVNHVAERGPKLFLFLK